MRTPSIKTIKKYFPQVDAKLVKLLLTDDLAVETYLHHYGITKGFYNPPGRRYGRMLALNHALDMFGVEHIGQCGERAFSYLNTGDSYGTTLIQFEDKESIFVSSWGDIVENGNYR